MAIRIVNGVQNPPVSYSTITNAFVGIGVLDEIDLQVNINENVLVIDNFSRLFSSNASILDSTNAIDTLQIGYQLSQLLKIEDLEIRKSSGSGYAIIQWVYGAGAIVEFNRCVILGTPTSSGGLIGFHDPFPSDSVIFNRCDIYGANNNVSYLLWLSETTNASAVTFKNCKLKGGNSASIFNEPTTTNKTIKAYNCSIVDSQNGLRTNGGVDFKNVVFANNIEDLDLNGVSSVNDFSYCAFEEANELLGATNLCINQGTAINPVDEFINAGGNDYHLKPGAACRDTGTDTGATPDLDGRSRPQGVFYDIGAYEYGIKRSFII